MLMVEGRQLFKILEAVRLERKLRSKQENDNLLRVTEMKIIFFGTTLEHSIK